MQLPGVREDREIATPAIASGLAMVEQAMGILM